MAAQITVGDVILPAVECEVCPTLTRLYPAESLPAHFQHYHPESILKVARGRKGGRTAGSRNRMSMSASGIEIRGASIRRAR